MSKLAKDILAYGGIDLIARTIGLIVSPITTRLLSLGQYGAGPLLAALWAPVALLQYGGMDCAYPFFKAKTEDTREAKQMLVTATFISNFFNVVLWSVFAIIALNGVWLAEYAEISKFELLLFVLGILPLGLVNWMLYVLRYLQETKLFAQITILARILPVLIVLPLMMGVAQPERLVVSWSGSLVIQYLALLYSFYVMKKADIWPYVKSDFSFSLCKKMLKYGLFLAPVSMIYSLTSVVDRILVGWFYGPEEIAILQLAIAVGGVAMMLSSWFGMAFDPHLVEWIGKKQIDKYKKQLQNLVHILTATFFGMTCGAVIWSEWVFSIIYPVEYMQSAAVIPLFVFAGSFAVLSRIGISTILIADTPKKQFYVYAMAFVINLAIGLLSIPHIGILGAVLGTVAAEIFILSAWVLLGTRLHKNLMLSWRLTFISAAFVAAFIFLYNTGEIGTLGSLLNALIATCVLAALYFFYLRTTLGKAEFLHLLKQPFAFIK